jgi:hypothetical protein
MAARATRRLAPPDGGLFATLAKKLPVRQKKTFRKFIKMQRALGSGIDV